MARRPPAPSVTEQPLAQNPQALGSVVPAEPPPPIAPLRIKGPADLQREYVTGASGITWYGQFGRALPWEIDDVQQAFGLTLYSRMARDPVIAACLTVLKASILEDGLTLAPAVDDEADPSYPAAVALRDEAEAMLDRLVEPFPDVLWALLDALAYGHKVAELVWQVRPPCTTPPAGVRILPRGDLLALHAIKVKPVRTTVFVVDGYANVLGLLAQELNLPSPVLTGWLIDPHQAPPNLIPREKFAILTFRPQDSDPRGHSILRAAYAPWWLKEQLLPEVKRWGAQFAVPSVWATTPEKSQQVPQLDASGQPLLDAFGNQLLVSPEQNLLAALQNLRNGSAAALPFGTELHPLAVSGSGDALLRILAWCDQQMREAITTQKLATAEGEHMARAAAQVHQDVLATIVKEAKQSLVRMVQRDILAPWLRYNVPGNPQHLLPKPQLGGSEAEDWSKNATAVAALQTAGYLHASQLAATDKLLNLPVRDLTQDVSEDEDLAAAGPVPGADVEPPAGDASSSPAGAPPGGSAATFAATASTDRPDLPATVAITSGDDTAARHLWDEAVPALAGLLAAGRAPGAGRWSYDTDRHRYRDRTAGKLLPPTRLVRARDALADAFVDRTDMLAQQVADGEIDVPDWEQAMRTLIQSLFVAQYAAGRGGLAALTDADRAAIGPLVRDQWSYLAGFADAVPAGALSASQIAARAALYLASSVQAFELGQAAAHGVELPGYPGDGSCDGLSNCRCWWELAPADAGQIAATWRTERDRRVCDPCAARGDDWNPVLLSVPADARKAA